MYSRARPIPYLLVDPTSAHWSRSDNIEVEGYVKFHSINRNPWKKKKNLETSAAKGTSMNFSIDIYTFSSLFFPFLNPMLSFIQSIKPLVCDFYNYSRDL